MVFYAADKKRIIRTSQPDYPIIHKDLPFQRIHSFGFRRCDNNIF